LNGDAEATEWDFAAKIKKAHPHHFYVFSTHVSALLQSNLFPCTIQVKSFQPSKIVIGEPGGNIQYFDEQKWTSN
jgi:hypothetical protein